MTDTEIRILAKQAQVDSKYKLFQPFCLCSKEDDVKASVYYSEWLLVNGPGDIIDMYRIGHISIGPEGMIVLDHM